jgi:16S rRNA processing protein RimM
MVGSAVSEPGERAPREAPATRRTRREPKAQRTASPQLLEIGRIARAHGVRGDVYVVLSTDRTERLDVGSRLQAVSGWLTVASAKPAGRRWLVHFEEVADRVAAERLANTPLRSEPIDDTDALWVHELIGARVVEVDGTDRGTCTAVLDNPAADLLELDDGALVPVTFVVGLADRVVTIDPPEGLFD